MKTRRSLATRGARIAVGGALALSGLAVLGQGPASADWAPRDPNDPKTPVTVTADALPTTQINGVVWSQAMRGDIVYAGGNFDEARPAGAAEGTGVLRDNLVAYDVTTGEMTDFDPSFDQQVRAVAVDGDRLYVGGEFSTVDGQPRGRLAAFDLTTGELVDGFAPQVNGSVQAIAVGSNGNIYVGGGFGGVGNQTRGNLAAFDAAGNLLDWAPRVTGGGVNALAVSPDGSRVAVGGMFMEVNDDPGQDNDPTAAEPGDGMALLDAVTGAALPMEAGNLIYAGNGEDDADGAITTLAADDDAFYGAGYTFSTIKAGTIEGVFAVNWDGTLKWVADCHGDSYSVHPQDGAVYTANHAHYCENIGGVTQGAGGVGDYPYYRAVAFGKEATGTATWEPDNRRYFNFEGQPSPSQLTWYPSINAGSFTGQSQGPWSVTGNDEYIVMAGEFTRVNGQAQQGLTRFAVSDLVQEGRGPTLFNASYPIQATSTEPGKVRISWHSNEDMDNEYLEYRLSRRAVGAEGSNLVHSRFVEADFWNPLGMTYTDEVAPGSYEYRLQARDPSGLTANSPWTPVTVTGQGEDSEYLEAVHTDEPTHWWRFAEEDGDATVKAADSVGFNPMTVGAGVVRGTQGAVHTDATNLGASLTGAADSVATSDVQDSPPDLFTLEAWFRTTSTTGGRIVGRDNVGGFRTKADRHLYLDEAGHVAFGVKPDAEMSTIASSGSYNDGAWHHAAGVLSPDGMQLYVDGVLQGTLADVTVGEHLAIGYWRVGGTAAGIPGSFVGDVDEVAVYKRALSAAELTAHVEAAGEPAPNAAPTASVAVSGVNALTATFDGSASNDPDGAVQSYRWSFGDGTSAKSDTPVMTHTYENAGTYTVSLTVLDNLKRSSAPATVQVTVIDPTNVAPTAAFTATEAGLRPRFDGSASADPDGTIKSYAWDFGNGRTSTSQSPRGDYRMTGPGTYLVTLTVTDNDGATHTVKKNVTISETAEPVLVDLPPDPTTPPTPPPTTSPTTPTTTPTTPGTGTPPPATTSKATASLKGKAVTKRVRGKVAVKVVWKVARTGGGNATGKVTVKVGKKKFTGKLRKGKVTIKLGKYAARGKLKVKARYGGDATTAAASRVLKIKLR
ncbi:PKD domain-containing protein [Nocardioides sediminis]|uniref:PKD domain-containing protein n=1 Tax=Nocardioides sediminis TaxID=433648 RepID=UPI00131F1380|nr:PKD domain-containing protein [Nocardioides sediminis]